MPSIEIHNNTYYAPEYAPAITDAAHAGRTLRALALPSISVIIRAIVAALPASFWISVVQLVLRLMPYLTTQAMAGAEKVVSQDDVESAINKTK